MTWPSPDVNRTNCDSDTDTPTGAAGLSARVDILDLIDKFNQMRNHVSAFIQGLLDDADATTARGTLGAAPLASPTFTGTPAAPTASPGTNTTQLATTGFVKAAIDVVLGGVSSAFDTLSEIATELGLKAPLASPVFTGNPTAPTPAGGDNDTSIATTAFVQGEIAAKAPLASPTFTGIVTTAGQIAFPAAQNPSANANTLDDYEEGTWTPGISFGGASAGITYGNQTGFYTKIGRMVFLTYQVSLNSKGSSVGAAKITGFPFTAGASLPSGANPVQWGNLNTTWVNVFTTATPSTTTGSIAGASVAATTNGVALVDTDFTNTTAIIGTIAYYT